MSPLQRLRAFTFLGALLLFGLEPLVGRLLLPAHGGGFHVWATALTVFQGTLLLGYLYCHVLAPRLGRAHLAVVLVPLLFLPLAVTPGRDLPPPLLSLLGLLAPPDPLSPVLSIVRDLLVGVCVPFAVLSTTGVIAQTWLAASDLPERHEPYQLYSASNLGSLVALVGYPLLVEPFLTLDGQRIAWLVAFLVYAGLAFTVVPRGRSTNAADASAGASALPGATPAEPAVGSPVEPAPPVAAKELRREVTAPGLEAKDDDDDDAERTHELGPGPIAYWLGLAAAPSMALLAVTNLFALDIGSMPLVWILPLGLYLLSFVLAFGRQPVYPDLLRRFWPEVCLVGLYFNAVRGQSIFSGFIQLGVLFCMCLVAHGELYRSRPAPAKLTAFYLVVSIGGWLGGLAVSFVAPFVFTSLAEYPISMGLLAVTLLVGRRHALPGWLRSEPRVIIAGSALLVGIIGYLWAKDTLAKSRPNVVEVRRDVYGIYKVVERELNGFEAQEVKVPPGTIMRVIYHGTTLHGRQVQDPTARRTPISYYHPAAPLGDLLEHAVKRPRTGAIIGLGAGAAAAYFRAGDTLTIYEIDPDVVTLARRWFTYLEDCEAKPRVVLGDARLRLADDPGVPDGSLDILVVDAFSSDAIPVHLLTREALALYVRKLAPTGMLALHVSNRYYDLLPPIAANARALGLAAAWKSRNQASSSLEDVSEWIVLAKSGEPIAPLAQRSWRAIPLANEIPTAAWTDDYSNLLGALIHWNVRGEWWSRDPLPPWGTAPVAGPGKPEVSGPPAPPR